MNCLISVYLQPRSDKIRSHVKMQTTLRQWNTLNSHLRFTLKNFNFHKFTVFAEQLFCIFFLLTIKQNTMELESYVSLC